MKALEEKNAILKKKLEKILSESNLSFLDMKNVFGKADKMLTKTRLIDEFNEIIRHLERKMRRIHVPKE